MDGNTQSSTLRVTASSIIRNYCREHLFIKSAQKTGLTVHIIPIKINNVKYEVNLIDGMIDVLTKFGATDIIFAIDHYSKIKQILIMASEYLDNYTPPVWNTVENAKNLFDFINEMFSDTPAKSLYCIKKHNNRTDMFVLHKSGFYDSAVMYIDALQLGNDRSDILAFNERLGGAIKNGLYDADFLVSFDRIKQFAEMLEYSDDNISMMPILNNVELQLATTEMCKLIKEEHANLIDHVKKQLPAIKSKYTRNKKEIPEEISDSFVINGVKFDWSLDTQIMGPHIPSSMRDSYDNIYSIFISADSIIDNKKFMSARVDFDNLSKCLQTLRRIGVTAKSGECYFSPDRHKRCYPWEWEQAVSLMYVLSFISGSQDDFDVDETKNMVLKIFNNIREQTDKHMLAMKDNIAKKNNENKNKKRGNDKKTIETMSNAEITTRFADIKNKITTFTKTYGNINSDFNEYYNSFTLPQNFDIEGEKMHISIRNYHLDKNINISVQIKKPNKGGDSGVMTAPINMSILTGKSKNIQGGKDLSVSDQNLFSNAAALIVANIKEFINILSKETDSHILHEKEKIEEAKSVLYDNFPEEYMGIYLDK